MNLSTIPTWSPAEPQGLGKTAVDNHRQARRQTMNVSKFVRQAILGGGLMGLVLTLAMATAWGDALAWANTTQSGAFFTNTNWTPVKVPANGDSITLGAGSYTVSKTGSFTAASMTIGTGVVFENQGDLTWDLRNLFSNDGTIKFTGSNLTWRLWDADKIQYTIYNSGLIEADGIVLSLTTRNRTLNNTGGTIQAVNGATINWNTSGGFGMIGGTYLTDTTSTTIIDGVNKNQTVTGLAVVNQGYTRIVERTGGASGNTQITGYTGLGSLNNSGTLLLENRSVDTRSSFARITLGAGSSFSNTGTIILDQATGFANANVLLQSPASLTNQGTIDIRNPRALFQVTGAGNSFTQTGASSLVNLVNGGALTAATVAILEGALTGVGTITGNSTIGANATVAPGASIGTLTFVGNLTLQGTYEAEVDSLLGTADLLAVTGALVLDGAVLDVSLLDIERGTHSLLIATATGGITGSFASVLGPYGPTYEIAGNNLYLLMTIPEPTSLALLGLGGVVALRRRRRGV